MCRIKFYIIFFVVFLFQNLNIFSQCQPQYRCFDASEELYYDVYYNWGFIWVDAGKVEFKTKKETLFGQDVIHFSGTGVSLPKHDWFFKVRDYFDSWATEKDLSPVKHIRNTSEGNYKANETYLFDYSKNKIYTDVKTSEKSRKQDTLSNPGCVFDVMTAVYFARTYDFSKYSAGQKIPLSMIVDNKIYKLYGRYMGKETIKNKNKKSVNCLKFTILLIEGTMFKGGEDLHVWLSDDANRVPILIEAEVLVGSVKAYLSNTKNLKQPQLY